MELRGLQAVVFDMDGILADTEPRWWEAEIACAREVGLDITEQDCPATQGVRISEITRQWFAREPWEGPTTDELADRIVDHVVASVHRELMPLPGAVDAIAACRARGLQLGLATSSAPRLMDAVLGALNLTNAFHVTKSASGLEYGKPHPQVYLDVVGELGCDPSASLAVEDSITGILSARSAGMKVVAVPDPHLRGDQRLSICDAVLSDLSGLERLLMP